MTFDQLTSMKRFVLFGSKRFDHINGGWSDMIAMSNDFQELVGKTQTQNGRLEWFQIVDLIKGEIVASSLMVKEEE